MVSLQFQSLLCCAIHDLFIAFAQGTNVRSLLYTVCIRYSYVPKNIHVHVTFFVKIEIAKKLKTHPLPFCNTDQNMLCKIPLTKILNWTAGCEL